MRLLVAAAMFVAAHAASLGYDKCTWGPSYWCSSLDTATTCQAFTHCLDSVWKHQLLAVKETDVCLYSEKLVETIRNVLSSKNEKDEATYLIASMCTFVKDEALRKTCKYTVTKFLPEIFQLMNSTAEPISVAAVLGLCKPLDDSDNELPELPNSPLATDDSVCSDCHIFVSQMEALITGHPGSEEKFETIVEEIICSSLGGLRPACNAALKLVLPKMFKFMSENDHRHDICRVSAFCTKKPKLSYLLDILEKPFYGVFEDLEMVLQEDTEDALSCHECGKVVTSIMNFEKDSAFRESVEHALAYLCSHSSLGEEKCRLLSERLVPMKLISMATRDVDVKDVCKSTLRCEGPAYSPNEVLKAVPKLPTKVLPKPSVTCDQCQQFFSDVSRVLESSIFVPEVTNLAKTTLCQQTGKFTTQCHAMLDRVMPSILKSLAEAETPESFCSQMTLCPADSSSKKFDFVKVVSATLEKDPLHDIECDACEAVVLEAREAARDLGVQKGIVDLFNNICDKLGQEAQQCKDLVQQYAQQLFEIIVSEMEPTVLCEILFSCTKPEESMVGPDINDEPETEVVVPDEVVIALDEEPQTQTHHSLVYKKSKQNSAAYASQHSPVSKKKPKKNSTAHDAQNSPMLKKSKKNSAMYKQQVYKLEVHEGESPACAVCKLAMDYIDQVIGENSTEQEIEKGLKDLCNLLPSSVKDVCNQFVAEYTPALINLLVQRLDPKTICMELKVCNETKPQLDKTFEAEKKEEYDEKIEMEAPTEKPTCTICEIIMGIIITQVGENRSEADIQKALDDVCSILPSDIKEECLSFVNEYSSFVVQMILQDMEPHEICATLDLCDKTEQVAVPMPVIKFNLENQETTECELCKIIINELNNILGENRTEEALIHAVETVCDLVSGDLRLQCKSEVENYGPAVLDLLRHMDDPDQICRAIKLCASNADLNSSGQKTKKIQSEGDICVICETLANYAEEAVKEQTTVEEVEKILMDVCTILPKAVKADCDTLVKEYTPKILEYLAEKDNPLEVCQELKLCPKNEASLNKKDTPMLGVDACTFGPAFWCANIDNARKCGMEKDCIEKYGMKP